MTGEAQGSKNALSGSRPIDVLTTYGMLCTGYLLNHKPDLSGIDRFRADLCKLAKVLYSLLSLSSLCGWKQGLRMAENMSGF